MAVTRTLLIPILPALPMLQFSNDSVATMCASTCKAAQRGGSEVNGEAMDVSLNIIGDNAGEGRRALSMREAAANVADAEDPDDA